MLRARRTVAMAAMSVLLVAGPPEAQQPVADVPGPGRPAPVPQPTPGPPTQVPAAPDTLSATHTPPPPRLPPPAPPPPPGRTTLAPSPPDSEEAPTAPPQPDAVSHHQRAPEELIPSRVPTFVGPDLFQPPAHQGWITIAPSFTLSAE